MTPERWRQIEELYQAARARDPAARPAFLERACGPDAELRREVESLLAGRTQAESFLETHPTETTQTQYAGPAGRSLSNPLSARRRRDGRGVSRARQQARPRRRPQNLPPAFAADPERLARFRREARTLASLNHPNIAAIYGLEESEGATCLVLELVEGETLRGPLPVTGARLRPPGGGGTGSGARARESSTAI